VVVVVAPVLSVAVIVMVAVPFPVGVPLIVNEFVAGDGGLSVNPAGKVPATLYVIILSPVPPLAEMT